MYQKIKAKFKANPTIFYACSIVASWAGVGSLMNFRTLAINRQQNEEHVPYAAVPTYPVAPPDPQPVSTVSEPPQQPSPVSGVSTPTEPETAAPEAASGAEQHRYIRCPKCGELICL